MHRREPVLGVCVCVFPFLTGKQRKVVGKRICKVTLGIEKRMCLICSGATVNAVSMIG